MHIASKDNPKIKLYSKLLSSKKARAEHGLFVLEGARLCSEALTKWKEGKLKLHSVFATKNALVKYPDYIDNALFDQNPELFYTVDDKVADKLGETKESQGVYVIAYMSNNNFDRTCIKSNGKYLVMNNLQDPGNVGTILRTCDAVGIDGVVMTSNCCDLYNPKVLRAAMGSVFRLNVYTCDDFSSVCKLFESRDIKTMAAVVDKDAQAVESVDYTQGGAIVIGNEGKGLKADDVSLCDMKITIKMQGNIESLNAAMAAGIILWEMNREQL